VSDSEQSDVSLDDEISALLDGDVTDDTPEEQEAAEAAANEQEGDQSAQDAVEEALEALSPPDRWDQRYKEAFNALNNPDGLNPRDVQQAWLDYHKERQGYHTQLEQERAYYANQLREFQEVVEPYNQTWQMAGLTPAQGVRQLMGWAGSLQKDPQGTIERLAQSVGIDLAEYAQQKLQEQEWQDPQVKGLEKQVSALTAHLRGLQEQTLRGQQSAQEAAIDQQLTAFRDAVDEHGNRLHPHYEAVKETMGALAMQHVQQGQPVPPLDQLYEQATWAVPTVREQLLRAQMEQDSAQKASAAERAATASRSVKSKGAGSDTAPAKSIDEELSDAIDAMAG
jgi:hypothetical protein